jgi:hypothetical protein
MGVALRVKMRIYLITWYTAPNRPIGNIIYNAGLDIRKFDPDRQRVELKKCFV